MGVDAAGGLVERVWLADQEVVVHLDEMLSDCLERCLFTVEEAWLRIAQPDMASHAGAERLRQVLPR
ncbi:MAG: hypothetical protein JJE52_09440 [Acidimicrobiia bacterium]|nr:hypothetical protein [Acidimicrobiia bacterium]